MRKTTVMKAMTVITTPDITRLGALVSLPPGGGGRPRGFDMRAEREDECNHDGGGRGMGDHFIDFWFSLKAEQDEAGPLLMNPALGSRRMPCATGMGMIGGMHVNHGDGWTGGFRAGSVEDDACTTEHSTTEPAPLRIDLFI